MYQKIREHVDSLFVNAPPSAKMTELREEIIANLSDKYADLTAHGMEEQQAYNRVIAGIGDVDELIASQGPVDYAQVEQQNRRSALLTAIAIGMYIFSFIPSILLDGAGYMEDIGAVLLFLIAGAATGIIIFANMIRPRHGRLVDDRQKKRAASFSFAIALYVFSVIPPILIPERAAGLNNLGAILMFLIIGVATVILVYSAMSRPRYIKTDDTIVEEFKQWQYEQNRGHSVCHTIQSIVWILTVVLYLIINFSTGAWAVSWLLFIIASVINKIIRLCFELIQ